jgi:excisionase family DNA binding protein
MSRLHNNEYSTNDVAKILGVSVRTLYRMLASGRIPEPRRNETNGRRAWSEIDVQELQDNLGKQYSRNEVAVILGMTVKALSRLLESDRIPDSLRPHRCRVWTDSKIRQLRDFLANKEPAA